MTESAEGSPFLLAEKEIKEARERLAASEQ